jgi:hypothetical protein
MGGGGGGGMMPVGSMPMPGGPAPALPTALQPISTSVHEQGMMSQPTFPQQQPPMGGGGAPVYNPNPFGQAPMSQQPMPGAMSSDTINQIMSTINVAGNHLPSRDIPMMNPHDDQSRPNYVPGGGNGGDYIQQYSDFAEIAKRNKEKEGKDRDIFDRLQIPIMCAVIFFLFQLPIVRKSLFKYVPSLYFTDGNPKISALLVQAAVFGAGVYLLNTFTQ